MTSGVSSRIGALSLPVYLCILNNSVCVNIYIYVCVCVCVCVCTHRQKGASQLLISSVSLDTVIMGKILIMNGNSTSLDSHPHNFKIFRIFYNFMSINVFTYIHIYIYMYTRGVFNKFPDFFVQAFKIVIDS